MTQHQFNSFMKTTVWLFFIVVSFATVFTALITLKYQIESQNSPSSPGYYIWAKQRPISNSIEDHEKPMKVVHYCQGRGAFPFIEADCRKYAVCEDEGKLGEVFDCREGSLFDPLLRHCIPAILGVNCQICAHNRAIPYPGHLSSYVQCSNGVGEMRRCPKGTIFSPILSVCMTAIQSRSMYTTSLHPTIFDLLNFIRNTGKRSHGLPVFESKSTSTSSSSATASVSSKVNGQAEKELTYKKDSAAAHAISQKNDQVAKAGAESSLVRGPNNQTTSLSQTYADFSGTGDFIDESTIAESKTVGDAKLQAVASLNGKKADSKTSIVRKNGDKAESESSLVHGSRGHSNAGGKSGGSASGSGSMFKLENGQSEAGGSSYSANDDGTIAQGMAKSIYQGKAKQDAPSSVFSVAMVSNGETIAKSGSKYGEGMEAIATGKGSKASEKAEAAVNSFVAEEEFVDEPKSKKSWDSMPYIRNNEELSSFLHRKKAQNSTADEWDEVFKQNQLRRQRQTGAEDAVLEILGLIPLQGRIEEMNHRVKRDDAQDLMKGLSKESATSKAAGIGSGLKKGSISMSNSVAKAEKGSNSLSNAVSMANGGSKASSDSLSTASDNSKSVSDTKSLASNNSTAASESKAMAEKNSDATSLGLSSAQDNSKSGAVGHAQAKDSSSAASGTSALAKDDSQSLSNSKSLAEQNSTSDSNSKAIAKEKSNSISDSKAAAKANSDAGSNSQALAAKNSYSAGGSEAKANENSKAGSDALSSAKDNSKSAGTSQSLAEKNSLANSDTKSLANENSQSTGSGMAVATDDSKAASVSQSLAEKNSKGASASLATAKQSSKAAGASQVEARQDSRAAGASMAEASDKSKSVAAGKTRAMDNSDATGSSLAAATGESVSAAKGDTLATDNSKGASNSRAISNLGDPAPESK